MQFNLSRMFGAVAFIAIGLSLLLYFTKEYRRQLAIRSDLHAIGAYSVRFGPGGEIQALFHDPVASARIAKYREFGVLDFKESHVTTASLNNLSGLEKVGVVTFSMSDVRDEHILQLKKIGKIQTLFLKNTKVTDACVDALIDLPHLESIKTANTLITQSGLNRLRTAKPSLKFLN
jgi:hypothetical protein